MKKNTPIRHTYLLAVTFMVLASSFSFGAQAQAATAPDIQVRLGQLQLLLQTLLTQLNPAVKGVSTIVVSSDLELALAIKNATGGETIQLAPGTYSPIQLIGGTANQLSVGATKMVKGVPLLSAVVTITSQDPTNPAVVRSIEVKGSNRWHFKGLAVRPIKASLVAYSAVYLNGADCSIEDSTITYGDATGWSAADWASNAGNGVYIYGANNLVRNNTLRNVYMGIEVGFGGTGTIVKNNTVDGISGSGFREQASTITIDSNLFKNFKKINTSLTSCSQSWGMATGTLNEEAIVKNVIFQNNICLNNENPSDPLYNTSLQGFGAYNSSMQGWTVQNNVFAGTGSYGLTYSGAVNMTLRNNTILDSDAVIGGADNGWIRVIANKTATIQPTGNTFQNNISNKVPLYGSSSTATNNQIVKIVDYAKYFRDWRHGDVRLIATSPLKTVGADLDPATVGGTLTITTFAPVLSPMLSFAASDATVASGSPVTLSWSSKNVSTCKASGSWSGAKVTGGSESTTSSDGLNIFTLTCTGVGGAVTKTVTIGDSSTPTTVTPDPETVIAKPALQLSAAPAVVSIGGDSTLTWTSTNATACTATGAWRGPKDISGSESAMGLNSVGVSTYSLKCTGEGGTISKSVVVRTTAEDLSNVATDTMQVKALNNVTVRTTPDGDTAGIQHAGARGMVTEPSVMAAGREWLNVDFDDGVDGYVAKRNLAIIPTATTTPAVVTDNTEITDDQNIAALLKQLAALQQLLITLLNNRKK